MDLCELGALQYNGRMKKKFTLTAVVYKEGKLFVAECPQFGVVSQGKSMEEALENLKEATELYLEEFPEETAAQTFFTTFEAVYA